MYFREVTEEQARARNLLISIAKGLHNEDEINKDAILFFTKRYKISI